MKYLLLSLLMLILCFPATADELKCTSRTPDQGTLFTDMYAGVEEISLEICNALVAGANVDSETSAWFYVWKDKLTVNLKNIDYLEFDADFIVEDTFKSLKSLTVPKQINATQLASGSGQYSLKYDDIEIAVLDNAECKKTTRKDCRLVFDDLNKAIRAPFEASLQYSNSRAGSNIALKSQAWSDYFENSRSLTTLDLMVNTWFYKKQLQGNKLAPPPDKQYFVLHPTIGFHYSDSAEKGERIQEALTIEWAGINYWNSPLPWGVSAISTYADRKTVKAVSHGLMLHVDNKYSIAFTTNSDSEHGVFVTFDLFKMFEDKASQLKAFKEKL